MRYIMWYIRTHPLKLMGGEYNLYKITQYLPRY